MGSDREYRGALAAWTGGFGLILVVHLVWHALDRMPPAWDMAFHQRMGWSFYQALRNGASLSELVRITDYYPPLYYLVEAAVHFLFGTTRWLSFLSNLPGLFLLGFFTFRIAWDSTGSRLAPLAGHFVLLFPLVAWTSRETLLDVTLSGLLALALFLLVRSRGLLERKPSMLFGAVLAAGMLAKWTFVLFVAPPVLYCVRRSIRERRFWRNLLDAGLIALPVVFLWYLPNFSSLVQRFQMTTAGASWEQDPEVWSLLGLAYYLRCLSGYYLFLPLTILFSVAAWRLARRPDVLPPGSGPFQDRGAVALVVWTLAGGLLLLTLLKAKDPRYVMPLVVPVALILFWGLRDLPKLLAAAGALAFLQYLLISFSFPLVPEKIALFDLNPDPDYSGMRQEWVLFETNYFGVVGPPRVEDWRYDELLERMSGGGRVGFVPDAVFFHPGALELAAAREGIDLRVYRLGLTEDWEKPLAEADWVVGKTGSQGISYITLYSREVYGALKTLGWPEIATWELPDGSQAMIWRNPSRSR